jgi:hypothetical protein
LAAETELPPPTFILPEHLLDENNALDSRRLDAQDRSWIERGMLATKLLDTKALKDILNEIRNCVDDLDAIHIGNYLDRNDQIYWVEALTATIKNVKAYREMVDEPRKRQRLAELQHELDLKDKEIEIRRLELEVEQARLERQDRERQAEREHDLRKRRMDSVDATLRAVILAQAEFRDNPLAGELVGRFRGIYHTLDKMGYQVDLDEDVMRDLIEQIALRHFTKQTGIKIE